MHCGDQREKRVSVQVRVSVCAVLFKVNFWTLHESELPPSPRGGLSHLIACTIQPGITISIQLGLHLKREFYFRTG